jgi:hypothetical protein
MNRSKIKLSGGSLLVLGGILLSMSLLLPGQAVLGNRIRINQETLLGEPPLAPAVTAAPLEAGAPLEAPLAAQAGGSCSRSNCFFLPFLANPAKTILDRETAVSLYKTLYVPGNSVSPGWNGNTAGCVAGTTTAAYQDAILKRLNFFRLAAGIPALKGLNAAYNTKAQAAALMMSKAGSLSHQPGTDWPCYTAIGAEAAGSSNLYLGRSGPDAISGYVRDPGSTNSAAGHRRWILLPQTQQMGTGDIPPGGSYSQANALWVFDTHTWDARPQTRSSFVAWPPAGDIPYPVVFARWSFAYPNADFTQAKVSMTKNNSPISVTRYDTVKGYGENTLVWIIGGMGDGDNWPRPSSDVTYTVSIKQVMISGASKNFQYSVTIFDPGQ